MKRPARNVRPYPPIARHEVAKESRDQKFGASWEVVLAGDLTERQSELLAQLVEVPRNSRGIIYFDSCGGSTYVGLSLANLIKFRGLDADAVVIAECSSAAILPFAACTRRYVTPQSSLLFHPIRWTGDEDMRLEEAAEWARHFRVLEEDMDQLLEKLLDFPLEKIREWSRPGRFISGQQMADAGLAHMLDIAKGDVWSQIRDYRLSEKKKNPAGK